MLRLAAVLGLAALAGPSWSQTSAAPEQAEQTAAAPADAASGPVRVHKAYRERFEAANTTHDGHLTREQARAAKMTLTVRRFDEIDRGHKGYVTLDDLRDFMARMRAEHHPPPQLPAQN
jgi:hypothetical protein